MKKFLFLIIAISAIFLISCGDSESTDKTCDPACSSWETCNNEQKCELSPEMCNEDNDCKDVTGKPKCNLETHKCIADEAPECTINDDCKDLAKPVCDNGTCVEDSTPECTINDDCKDLAKPVCDNGTCVEDSTQCTENDLRCNADKKEIEKCNSNGEWQYNLSCSGLMLCVDSGNNNVACEEPATCIKDSTRCLDDENLETCDASGNWVSTKCETGKECIEDDGAAACETPLCDENDNRCSDDGKSIIECPDYDNGTEVVVPCEDNEVCTGSGAETKCVVKTDAPSLEEIEEAMMISNACGLSSEVSNINEGIYFGMNILNIFSESFLGKGYGFFPMDSIKDDFQNAINCIKENTTCLDIASCMDIEITEDSCTPSEEYVVTCDGNKLVDCSWKGKVIKKTCKEGTTCDAEENECMKERIEECDDTFIDKCNADGTATICQFGKIKTFSCGEERTCQIISEDGEDELICMPNSSLPDCDEDTFEEHCDGQYSVKCNRGKVVKADCEVLAGPGYICKEDPSFFEAFLFLGCVYNEVATTCDSYPSCDGDTLKYCVNGVEKTYNCTENSYASCDTESVEIEDEDGQPVQQDIGFCNF